MPTRKEIFTSYGQAMVAMLKGAVPKATGKTAASIHFEATNNSLKIFGREFFQTIETGRGPRKSSAYGSFDKSMEEYLLARGVPFKTSKSGVKYFQVGKGWSSAKSLAHKINVEGDKTFKAGGRQVYSDELRALTQSMMKELAKTTGKEVLTLLKNGLIGSQTPG